MENTNTQKTNSEEMENLARDAMRDEPLMSEADVDAFAKLRGEDGPAPGTYAFTARIMAGIDPSFDWDSWKDEMKEKDM
jgi:hypothetical protein